MIVTYLIRMIFCSLFLYLVYAIGLENEKMHRFKRFYLLASIILSLLIPQWVINIPAPVENINTVPGVTAQIVQNTILLTDNPEWNASIPNEIITPINISLCLTISYILITCIFLFIFLQNLLKITLKKNKAFTYYQGIKIILLDNKTTPHSFGNKIYISSHDYYNNLPEKILIHESEHIRQKHSYDIIFIELLLCIFWFNPVFYLYRNKIKLNHEFLADQAVIETNPDIAGYQTLLLNEIIKNKRSIGLTSHLNFLTTKKRFIMMTKKTSKKSAMCRKAMVIPVMALSIILFSAKSAANNNPNEKVNKIIESTVDATIIPGQGVDESLLKEYNDIVSKYQETTDGEVTGWKTKEITDMDRDKLYPIYVQMTEEQRKKQFLHLVGPFTAFKLRSPNVDEWRSCKNVAFSWINEVKSEPAELEKYKRHDLVFFTKFLNKETGLKESAVWTKQGYDDYINKYQNGISLESLLVIKPQLWFRRFKK